MHLRMVPPAPVAQAAIPERYEPSAWESFKIGIGEGFDWTTLGVLGNLAGGATERWKTRLSEQEWRDSEWFRQGLAYDPGMSPAWAERLADRHDAKRVRAWLSERMGWGDTIARIAGDFIGSIPDPLNFIPFLGMAKLSGPALRILGRVGGRSAIGAADAAIGVGLFQPLLAAEHAAFQDDFDLKMAAANVAFATVIGSGFGAIAGRFSRLTPEERIQATAKAVADLIHERSVDVSPIIPVRRPVTDAVRQFLDRSPPEPQRRRAPESMMAGALAAIRGEKAADIVMNISQPAAERHTLATAMADQYAGDILTVADAVSTPGYRRTSGQRALLDGLDLSLADERALRIWSAPEAGRTADDVEYLKAYRAGEPDKIAKEEATALVSQAEELNHQAVEIQKSIAEAEAGLRAVDPKDAERLQQLTRTRDELQIDAARLRREAESLAPGTEIDWTAAPEPEGPGHTRPLVEDVEPLKTEVLGEPDDTDIALIDARFADLESAGELPPAAAGLLDDAEVEGGRFARMAKAVEQGLACLLRG